MLMIRLQRVGRKHEPMFRLVLTDSQNGPRSGKFLEILGNYDARKNDSAKFNNEKIKHWISKGVQLSTTVHNLLIDMKVIGGKKLNALPKKMPIVSEKVEADSAKSSQPSQNATVGEAVEPKEKVIEIKEEAPVESPAEVPAEALVETPTEAPTEVAEKTAI